MQGGYREEAFALILEIAAKLFTLGVVCGIVYGLCERLENWMTRRWAKRVLTEENYNRVARCMGWVT